MHYFKKRFKVSHPHFSRKCLIASIWISMFAVSVFSFSSCHALSSEQQTEALATEIPPSTTERIATSEPTTQAAVVPETEPINAAYRLDHIEDPDTRELIQNIQTEYEDFSPVDLVNFYLQELQTELESNTVDTFSPDETVIPDKRNTGLPEDKLLKSFYASSLIGYISDAEQTAGKMPLYIGITQQGFYNLNGYANTNCSGQVIIEGYNFSSRKLYMTNDVKFPSQTVIIFKNCKMGEIQFFGGNAWIVLDHCQVDGRIAGNNIIIKNSYLNSHNSDAINPVRNVIIKGSYIADLFIKASPRIVHLDGIQIYGDQHGGISENIMLDNVRFSIPQLYYKGSVTYVNAAINLGLEFSAGKNYMFRNIMIDTGGPWYPIYNTTGENALYKDIQVGNGYGSIFYTGYINPKAAVKNVRNCDGLYVSSVWKDEQQKTHFLCSNNNVRTGKILRVVTDQKEYTFHIDRHPAPRELTNNPTFQTYRFKDLPYDLEFIIEEDITFAEFFDGQKKLRSVTFEN